MLGSHFPCPDSINREVWDDGTGEGIELTKIYNILTRCSSVRILNIKLVQAGCVISPDADWKFDFQPGDSFPPLHQLHLDNYDFSEYPPAWQEEVRDRWDDLRLLIAQYTGLKALRPKPKTLTMMVYPGANLVKWKAAMNWTALKDLDLEDVNPIFFALMEGELPALKSLRLGPLWPRSCQGDNITNFVTQLSPLFRLSLHGHTNQVNFTRILDRHAHTLHALEIREWEGGSFPRPTLSLQQLKQISEKCPSLTKLGVDINRNGNWPLEMLDSLAANKNLSSLEIFFELGMDLHPRDYEFGERWSRPNKTRDYRQPVVDTTSALDIFKRLRALKRGVELLQLTLNVGDVGRDYGHMLRISEWGEGLAETYVCSVLDSDGQRKAEGVAWCEPGSEPQNPYNDDNPFEFEGEEDEDEDELRMLQAAL